ncbi:MAG: hypothetical protein HY542_04875 [Deltaproteobacteria bacterium]|nr:hypothetical protein [Deltaproteobacteria bacterium]
MLNTKTILQRLLENNIDFVLVGGLAATLYGASTVTYDIDICFDFSGQNVQKMLDALKGLNPRVRMQSGWVGLHEIPLERLSELKNLYLQTDCGGLDLLGSLIEIGDYRQAKQRSQTIDVFNKPCQILEIEALIQIKENIGRPKDHQVALELKAILEKSRLKEEK